LDVTLKQASEDDAPSIIEMRNQSFSSDFIQFGECPGYHIPLEQMRMTLQRAAVYGIFAEGRMVGDISVHRPDSEGCYWIGCLEIIPEYQNRGIGTQVLRNIFELYPNARKWQLETPVQNLRNCCFYEKLGFRGIQEKICSDKLTLRLYEKVPVGHTQA
jgi:ribosomal protein S18 acetylase RimI-like enzyme